MYLYLGNMSLSQITDRYLQGPIEDTKWSKYLYILSTYLAVKVTANSEIAFLVVH
jgi:hypothetical protein